MSKNITSASLTLGSLVLTSLQVDRMHEQLQLFRQPEDKLHTLKVHYAYQFDSLSSWSGRGSKSVKNSD